MELSTGAIAYHKAKINHAIAMMIKAIKGIFRICFGNTGRGGFLMQMPDGFRPSKKQAAIAKLKNKLL